MVSRTVQIANEKGLHLRPAGKVCDLALNYRCKSEMHIGGRTYNLKSMLSVLSAQVQEGTTIEITCDGPDEEEAAAALYDLMSGDLEPGSSKEA